MWDAWFHPQIVYFKIEHPLIINKIEDFAHILEFWNVWIWMKAKYPDICKSFSKEAKFYRSTWTKTTKVKLPEILGGFHPALELDFPKWYRFWNIRTISGYFGGWLCVSLCNEQTNKMWMWKEGILKRHCLAYQIVEGCRVWQYGLWSFQTGGTKLERFLGKNQHPQRKLLNFENWISGEVSKIGRHFFK